MKAHVTYSLMPNTSNQWSVFFLGHHLGTLIRGAVSAYFRAPSGRGKLYASCSDVEAAMSRVAKRFSDATQHSA